MASPAALAAGTSDQIPCIKIIRSPDESEVGQIPLIHVRPFLKSAEYHTPISKMFKGYWISTAGSYPISNPPPPYSIANKPPFTP